MFNLKKFFISIIPALLLIISSSSVHIFADEMHYLENDIREDVIDISTPLDEDTYVSNVLSFDEIVNEFSNDNNISKDEASNILQKSLQPIDKNKKGNFKNATFRTISKRFEVMPVYKPTLKIYCKTSEESMGGSYHYSVDELLSLSIDRRYNGITKQFSGTVYANLETPNRIYWMVNGDFFHNGTTTTGSTVGVNFAITTSFTVSNSSNYFMYCYKTGRIHYGQ